MYFKCQPCLEGRLRWGMREKYVRKRKLITNLTNLMHSSVSQVRKKLLYLPMSQLGIIVHYQEQVSSPNFNWGSSDISDNHQDIENSCLYTDVHLTTKQRPG